MTPLSFSFHKYHGAGNDFIMINQFKSKVILDRQAIAFLCHRHLGIGADGLIMIEPTPSCAFKMTYFNSDGNEGSMCGNGGRAYAMTMPRNRRGDPFVSKAIGRADQRPPYCPRRLPRASANPRRKSPQAAPVVGPRLKGRGLHHRNPQPSLQGEA